MTPLHYSFNRSKRPILLLLHGFLGSMEQWRFLEKEWRNSFSILKIDLPGHGKTLEFSHSYTLNELALMIDDILLIEKIDQVHVVGHSMGGYLGCAFAKARPQKTASLHLINSMAGGDPKQRKLMRDRSIKLIQKHQEAYVSMAVGNLFNTEERERFPKRLELMKEHAQEISIESLVQALMCMRDRENLVPHLKNAAFPMIYIYGSRDEIIPAKSIEKECQELKAISIEINSGHMSLLTNPDDILSNMHFIEN